jgi:fructoselysine 6-kinase
MAVGRVASIGDNCIDEYMPPVGRAGVGGSALNVAVNLRRAGWPTAYLGAVGDDPAGQRILAVLDAADVARTRVAVVPGGRTAVTQIELGAGGERAFLSEDFAVGSEYSPSPEDLASLRDVLHAHLTVVGVADYRYVARTLVQAGTPISCDFRTSHQTDGLGDFAVAFYSAAAAEAEDLARRALAGGASRAVVTCGLDGSLAADADRTVWGVAEPVEAIDTCGAGDSYIAAFIAHGLAGADLEECMRAATRAAAATCRHLGAFPQRLAELNGVEA